MPFGWLLRDLTDSAIVYLVAIFIILVGFMLAAVLVGIADVLHHHSNDRS